MEFKDILYGRIIIPDWMLPFLRIPEFVRLRGVRLSNVDSIQYKDFNGPTRWDHSIAVAALALRCAEKRGLSRKQKIELSLAALLHDIASPPFAHSIEYVVENYNHELEAQKILSAITSKDSEPNIPIFASQVPQFFKSCEKLSIDTGINIDPIQVAKLIVGDSDLGFLINGSLDLDNADNVTRACLFLGIEVDKNVPLQLADWLAQQKHVPIELEMVKNEAVRKWFGYRKKLYLEFYNASDDELGREAFLQHLVRKARLAGLSRQAIIWKTDESLLFAIENLQEETTNNTKSTLKHLVQRYRLLEQTFKISQIEITDEDQLRILQTPQASNWIEQQLSTNSFEPFVLVKSLRHATDEQTASDLFPVSPGVLIVFKLTDSLRYKQLPDWLQEGIPQSTVGKSLRKYFTNEIRKIIPKWVNCKPWIDTSAERKDNVLENLSSFGNWSFHLSRNESIHAYPSTFVHTIPASFISALGLRGELILDPFGGTGQTAVEAIKSGCEVISSDSNRIAALIAKTKLSYLNSVNRKKLRKISLDDIERIECFKKPNFHLIDKWHHKDTFEELCRIRAFIEIQQNVLLKQFLKTSFSSILTSTTARRGEESSYFADNTPLATNVDSPPYHNAIRFFIDRINRNLNVLERFYSFIERNGKNPADELKRAKVFNFDARHLKAKELKIEEKSIAGIITSPPYLCMSDYTLGLRLSYYWLEPECLQKDFEREIAARRQRFRPEEALDNYLKDLDTFASNVTKLLKLGGFLAIVLASPEARAFKKQDIIQAVDDIFSRHSLNSLWSQWRPISWHRKGYQRLKEERLTVYTLE